MMPCLKLGIYYISVQKAFIYSTFNESHLNSLFLLVFPHVANFRYEANFRYVANFRFLTLNKWDSLRPFMISPQLLEFMKNPTWTSLEQMINGTTCFFILFQKIYKEYTLLKYPGYLYFLHFESHTKFWKFLFIA